MHLKNFSLIENEFQEYELSLGYDLLNVKLVFPGDDEDNALTINGEKS